MALPPPTLHFETLIFIVLILPGDILISQQDWLVQMLSQNASKNFKA